MSHTTARRRRTPALAVVAVAAVLAATGTAVLASAVPADAAPTLPITNGEATWGVKESFRKYVLGPIGKGQITVADGARSNDDGTFSFTAGKGTYDLGTHNITSSFDGKVTFQAHKSGDAWSLDMSISQVRVTTDNAAKTGKVIADVSSKDMSTGETTLYDDVELAALNLNGVAPEQDNLGYTWLKNIPATLTEAGAPAFGGFYAAGSALDPVTLKVKAAAPDPKPSSSSASPSDPAPSSSASPSTSAPTDDPDAPAKVVDGTLDWGVKESFRKYIVGPIAKGKVDLSDGATDNGDGYRFGKATGTYDPAEDVLTAAYTGTAHFLGHETDGHYELDLTFTELNLKVTAGKGVLYTGETALATFTADVAVKDEVIALNALPAKLTKEGAAFFGGFYNEGDELDPITTALALDADAELPGPGATTTGTGGGGGGPSVSLPLTGSSLTGIAAAGAGLIAAGGAALFLAARRRRANATA